MTVAVADIKVTFPEFISAGDALIGAKLAEAQTLVDYTVYSATQGDVAIKYMTAHLLATSPMGKTARMVTKDGRSSYLDLYDTLLRCAAAGGRVP